MLRDAALRAAPQHEGTSELQFGMRSAVLVLRSARAVEAPQIGAGVRASRRMRTPLMPRARGPHASRRRLRRLLSMREESAENGATMAKRIHDRASGASCKARVVAFPCFGPVPSCYRRQVTATRARAFLVYIPPLTGHEKRRVVAGRLFFSCYLQGNTGPRTSPSHVADAAVHHYLTRCRRGRG